MGETRVDLLHLLEDLRDAYPGTVEETILTEIMANALDSGASVISLDCNSADRTLTIIDNGSGMQRRDLARFHDIASSNKIRGQGIGFAGVGIKLGLLICEEVLTETRRGKTHVASSRTVEVGTPARTGSGARHSGSAQIAQSLVSVARSRFFGSEPEAPFSA